MSYWRSEYDDGWWTFYKDGIEIKFDNPNFGDLIVDEINNANQRIAELESAQRWHVVADGDLPNTYKPVLTVDMSEATRIPVPAFYNLDTNCWSTHFEYDLWVTHWMPLPVPPIMYGKESEE